MGALIAGSDDVFQHDHVIAAEEFERLQWYQWAEALGEGGLLLQVEMLVAEHKDRVPVEFLPDLLGIFGRERAKIELRDLSTDVGGQRGAGRSAGHDQGYLSYAEASLGGNLSPGNRLRGQR
jgi:hypothetical protein